VYVEAVAVISIALRLWLLFNCDEVCKWLGLLVCKRSDESPTVTDSYSYNAVVVWKGTVRCREEWRSLVGMIVLYYLPVLNVLSYYSIWIPCCLV